MKYKIIDNAMPDHVVDQWKDYYINHVRLESERRESYKEDLPYLSTTLTFAEFVNVFDAESWLLPYAQEFESKISIANLRQSHLNVNTSKLKGTDFHGHVDINTNWKSWIDDSYYVSCLVFLNPQVHGSQHFEAGFELGHNTVNNVFNRLVLFDGRMWHKAKIPTDDLIRLTGYWSFSNVKGTRHPRVGSLAPLLQWKRDKISLPEDQKNTWRKKSH